MPIIGKIGRKTTKAKLLLSGMYAFLIAASVIMVYPILLLVSGSTKSAVDTPDRHLIPSFLCSEEALYRKHMEGFFNENLQSIRICYQSEVSSYRRLEPPRNVDTGLVAEWVEFISGYNLPCYSFAISYMEANVSKGVLPCNLRLFKSRLSGKYGEDIDRLNNGLKTQFAYWSSFYISADDYLPVYSSAGDSPLNQEYFKFKTSLPMSQRYYFNTEGFYKEMFLLPRYPKGISQYNTAHRLVLKSWREVHLKRTVPMQDTLARMEWESFVRNVIHPRWLRVDRRCEPVFQEYLRSRYLRNIGALNSKYGTLYRDFDQVPIISGAPPESGTIASDWNAFLQGWKDPVSGIEFKIPAESISIAGPDFLFRDRLMEKYNDLSSLNSTLGTSFSAWEDIIPPQQDYHFMEFKAMKKQIAWEFLTRNFLTVFDYLLMHGHALMNTAIYCLLTMLCALVVNPLAAYALSRFRPPCTYKILLFLMLTMAFPPVVTQIPTFLYLREFNLLNTFYALILPTMANGYSIFILKGFFDSLPRELYESAAIDGASETCIFMQIAMSMSKPILAVVALNAFTSAYGNFMMALLVCQDRDMWTIMPFLFELQQTGGQGIIFASLLVASVPTLIIFILCQNVIMRGIIVPSEH